jgi:hypothetical protein
MVVAGGSGGGACVERVGERERGREGSRFFLYFGLFLRNEPGQNLFSRFDPFQWRQFIWRNLGSSRTMYTGVTTKSHHMHWLDSVRLLSHVSASAV